MTTGNQTLNGIGRTSNHVEMLSELEALELPMDLRDDDANSFDHDMQL